MSKRYIELYSGNRNRQQFPNPASFDVPFSAVRKISSPLQSMDPILNGVIYYKWQGGIRITGTLKNNSTDSLLVLRPDHGDLSPVSNYYLGYNISLNGYNNTSLNGSTRMIKHYEPSTLGVNLILAFNSIPAAGSGTFVITDSSTSSTIHIPTRDMNDLHILCFSQSYHDYLIIDETLSSGKNIVYRKIVKYNFLKQIATLDRPFPDGWQNTDVYTLRKTTPFESYILPIAPVANTIYLPYDPSQNLLDYPNKYIYNIDTVPDSTGGLYGVYFIVSAQFVKINTIDYLELTIGMNGNSLPLVGNHVNILWFSKDNFSPLNYNGSITSLNESVCYEITLISLTLPNSPLITGSRVMFYPYVYVEFSNISSPSGASRDLIYSNNPITSRALFIAPITDSSQPMNKGFVKIDAGAMTQTVKFKPNDALRLSVFLPDGSLFQTVSQDYLTPYPPNNLVQIGAVFAIRRT